IPLDRLPQVPRGSQMVMHSAIENEKFLSARHLDVVNAAHIYTTLRNQPTAWLNHEPCSLKQRIVFDGSHHLSKPVAKTGHVQFIVIREIGNAEATSKIKCCKSLPGSLHHPTSDIKPSLILNDQSIGI